jgi:GNAT superfamily N-acetyltransferase
MSVLLIVGREGHWDACGFGRPVRFGAPWEDPAPRPTAYHDRVDVVRVPRAATFRLRSAVLGWAPTELRIDDNATHLALVNEDQVIAVVSHTAWPCPDRSEIPARYFWAMAVDSPHQHQGHGRRLLNAVASHPRAAGEQLLWADARESAVGFYVICGATASTQTFMDDVTGLTDHRVIFTL